MSKIKFIIFIYLIISITQCHAVIWNCNYTENSFDYTTALNMIKVEGYNCFLSSNNQNAVDATSIEGQHSIDKTDDDVKFLWIRSNLKNFSSIFCQKFKNLEMIFTINKDILSVDENSVKDCKNLEVIHLHGNKISEVPGNLLSENSKLTRISIRANKLTSLPENFFLNQIKLEQLILEENKINFLPSKIFYPLVELQSLDLRWNSLQILDPEWFVNLKNLNWMAFGDNEIIEVPGGVFKSLNNLDQLFLGGNGIKTLSSDSFEGLQSLNLLSLFENEILDLPQGVFVPLKSLKWLYLSNNKLTVIHSDSFGSHDDLTLISLWDNKILAFDENVIDITAVWFLNMTNNLCCNEDITQRSGMKDKMRKCIRNYRTRAELLATPITTTVKPNQSTIIQIFIQPQFQSSSALCGTPMAGTGNIIGGTHVSKNTFPWIAALVMTSGDFFCGGTVVTETKVVTASHCIQNKGEREPLKLRDFSVLLGIHDLNSSLEPGRAAHAVEQIKMHPEWNPKAVRFDADIALLFLEQPIVFNIYIQPICLIDPTSNIAAMTSGVVVGFGKSEVKTQKFESIPKIIDTPIINAIDCFTTNYKLARFSSNRTFCGGTGKGEGVCNGDSGSGLFVKHDGVFYLRGIVSSSLLTGSEYCNVNTYSIFTDVLEYHGFVTEI